MLQPRLESPFHINLLMKNVLTFKIPPKYSVQIFVCCPLRTDWSFFELLQLFPNFSWFSSILPHSLRTLNKCPYINKLTHFDISNFSIIISCKYYTISYNYNAMIHLNSRILDLWLLLKDCSILIKWGMEEGRKRGGGGTRGRNPYTYKTASKKIIPMSLVYVFYFL